MFSRSRWFHVPFTFVIALSSLLGIALSVGSADRMVAPSEASLHNPTFDNHIWYEFNRRYQRAYFDGAWLPDDDVQGGPQDWRLWFLDGTTIIESDPEQVYAQNVEGVQMRPYDWGKTANQLAGLYQVIQNATPCLVYEFQMYGQSRPEDPNDHRTAVLKVGIDRAGWHPPSETDPAVHGGFPSTTVWGNPHDYKFAYGPLTVTAEAANSTIVVYTYGDAPGGRFHRVLWDTGSFQDVTPSMIHDPDNLPAPGGISNISVLPGSTSVTISWSTANNTIGQIYYRASAVSDTPPDYPNKIFLPIMRGSGQQWAASAVDKISSSNHSVTLTDLTPGHSYNYIIVSRGVSGEACVTVASSTLTFSTTP
jgi:hypothetical protein